MRGMVDILVSRGKYAICVALATVFLSTTAVSGLEYKATIITPQASIKQEKFVDSKELDKLNIGSQIVVKEVIDNWYRVQMLNAEGEGWISADEVIINDASFRESNLKKGEVTVNVLNVRTGPSTNDRVITQARKGNIVTIIKASNNWYEVFLSSGTKGWIHSDYIKITYDFPKGVINADSIHLMGAPEDGSTTLGQLKKNDQIYIKDYSNGWYNIITEVDNEGWIESKDVTVLVSENNNVNRSGLSRDVFENISAITEKYLGKKYVYGASGPNSFDCSGFSYYILTNYYGEYLKLQGIGGFPRRASEQANIGTTVNRKDLAKGDLVFFDTEGKIGNNISHVGIYIGNDQFIHASTSKKKIVKSSLSESYYNIRYMKAIRL